MENSTMEVDEIKSERHDVKLPFSIDNLLADKFEKCNSNDCEASTSAVISDLKSNFISDVSDNVDSDDDRCSNSSENVDVESSTVGDAQEFHDAKTADYGQSGIYYICISLSVIFFLVTYTLTTLPQRDTDAPPKFSMPTFCRHNNIMIDKQIKEKLWE
ncbi:unnamed protein product [Arctia plantaginis]|uniref:Uncharacterized protein n=1 Tax=Arctia plantaginis TaxID=874455 RepID=A0A8S1A8S4_ARCPL|nr:unnamed protein product [Arctia plantaginis]